MAFLLFNDEGPSAINRHTPVMPACLLQEGQDWRITVTPVYPSTFEFQIQGETLPQINGWGVIEDTDTLF